MRSQDFLTDCNQNMRKIPEILDTRGGRGFFGARKRGYEDFCDEKTKKYKKNKTFFQKPIAFLKKMWYNNQVARTWPLSQAAKTSPSHGEGMGSIPVGVTKKENIRTCSDVFFLSTPQAWYGITRQRAWNRRRRMASPKVHFCGLIPYATASQFHAATSCGFHPRLRRDLDAKGERYG